MQDICGIIAMPIMLNEPSTWGPRKQLRIALIILQSSGYRPIFTMICFFSHPFLSDGSISWSNLNTSHAFGFETSGVFFIRGENLLPPAFTVNSQFPYTGTLVYKTNLKVEWRLRIVGVNVGRQMGRTRDEINRFQQGRTERWSRYASAMGCQPKLILQSVNPSSEQQRAKG